MKHPLIVLITIGLALTAGGLRAAPDALDSVAEHWRASSRFGYGPSLGSPLPHEPKGQAWALAELDRAVAAARQPAVIPEPFRGFDLPLPELFAQEREDNAQRPIILKNLTSGEKPPVRFAAQMAERAANWRLAACGRASLESPLLARMTEFWFNHLNVSSTKFNVQPYVGHYVVHAIRPHVLGRFEDLLLASAQHPAMLNYLDQTRSVAENSGKPGVPSKAQGLNENYARELMELHTLGVNGGYTQQDVRELARILTGWTTGFDNASGFRFVARLHDSGDKLLLGEPIPAGGLEEGENALRRLARHPATAERISLRLAQWFVADDPPRALVQRLAQRYRATQGDMTALMRTLIESPETWQARHVLFKTPMDYACGVLTALGGPEDPRLLGAVQRFLRAAGQPMLAWQTPDGYKTDAATWLSPEALSRRADFALVAGRQLPQADTLAPWLPPAHWARIQQEPAAQQAGLALASPSFMRK